MNNKYMEEQTKIGNITALAEKRIYKEHNFINQKMPVLIVDDSPLIIIKITELLEDFNAVTILKACRSYAEAVNELEFYLPKIALLDINLPDKSGIELLQFIKGKSPETIVIMFTNQSSDYYKKLCLNKGADYFLDKSKDFDHIPLILTSLS